MLKLVKEDSANRGGRASLGVVLDAEQRVLRVAEAFEGLVVEVDMRQLDFAVLQGIRIDGEPVVL